MKKKSSTSSVKRKCKTNVVTCDICKKSMQKRSLKRHMNNHDERPGNFYCGDCDSSFRTKYTFQNHISNSAKHTAPKHKCNHCDKLFQFATGLKRHMQGKHTPLGTTKVQCDVCAKMISQLHFRRHRNIHNANHRYSCGHCSQTFHFTENLKVHTIKYHTAERPTDFTCNICGMLFMSVVAFNKHMRSVHTDMMTAKNGQSPTRNDDSVPPIDNFVPSIGNIVTPMGTIIQSYTYEELSDMPVIMIEEEGIDMEVTEEAFESFFCDVCGLKIKTIDQRDIHIPCTDTDC